MGYVSTAVPQQLRVNVPISRPAGPSVPQIVTDGTTDMCDPLVFMDRDLEHEELMLTDDVMECIADMLDVVEDRVAGVDENVDSDIEDFQF